MENSIQPLKLFISYTHKDKAWEEKLIPHLSLLVRQKYITIWHDKAIMPGTDINEAVMKALKESQIILLLISSDYLVSQYCYDIEMKEAMKLRQENGAAVIPVILRPVDLKGTPFDSLKSLPEDRKAVSLFQNEDEAYENIAKGIRQIAESWYAKSVIRTVGKQVQESDGKDYPEAMKMAGSSDKTNYGYEIQESKICGSTFVINNY